MALSVLAPESSGAVGLKLSVSYREIWKMISEELIEKFIIIGRQESNKLPEKLKFCNMTDSPQEWLKSVKHIESKNLEHLIKGLMIYCTSIGINRGSVSPVIFIYDYYLSKNPVNEQDFTRWIVRNRVNLYEPFGTLMHLNAETYNEFIALKKERDIRTTANIIKEERRQKECAILKKIKDSKKSTERLAAAIQRGDLAAVDALIKKGAVIDEVILEVGSLVEYAKKSNRSAIAEYFITNGIQ